MTNNVLLFLGSAVSFPSGLPDTKTITERILKERSDIKVAADLFYEGDIEGEKSLSSFGDQVLMTPHIGANTKDANYRAAKESAEQTVNFFNAGVIKNSVNLIKIPPELNTLYMNLALILGKLAYYMIKDFGQPYEIKITCYGNLYKHTSILVKSGIMGVLDNFIEEKVTPTMAEAIAHENGIIITPREPDDLKGHGDSITLDIVAKNKDKYTEPAKIKISYVEFSEDSEKEKALKELDEGKISIYRAYKEVKKKLERRAKRNKTEQLRKNLYLALIRRYPKHIGELKEILRDVKKRHVQSPS